MTTQKTVQYELIDLAGQIAVMFSFNRSIGHIYGCLYFSPTKLSLEEIALQCHMSKGNASIHLRTLESWGAVHRSSELGNRKTYYYTDSDLMNLALRRLDEGLKKRVDYLRKHIDNIKETHASQSPDNNNHVTERFIEIESILKKADSALSYLPQLKKLWSVF